MVKIIVYSTFLVHGTQIFKNLLYYFQIRCCIRQNEIVLKVFFF